MEQAASPLELIVVPQNGSSKWFHPKTIKKKKGKKPFPVTTVLSFSSR
jgi:hypothetical protein